MSLLSLFQAVAGFAPKVRRSAPELAAVSSWEDNDRVDCGHCEYIASAVPTPGGGLICRACHSRLLLSRDAPFIEAQELRTRSASLL